MQWNILLWKPPIWILFFIFHSQYCLIMEMTVHISRQVCHGRHSECWLWLLTWKVTEVVVSRMKKESWIGKYKPWLFPYLHTADQSMHEVGVNIGLLVLKSYKNSQTQPPHSTQSHVCHRVWLRGCPTMGMQFSEGRQNSA